MPREQSGRLQIPMQYTNQGILQLLLRISTGAVSEAEAEAAAPELIAAGSAYFSARHLCKLAIKHTMPPVLRHALFRGLLSALPPKDWDNRADVVDAARALLGSAPSGFEEPAVWDNTLQLPMPRPERRGASDRAPAAPAERRPVLVDEIVLRNLRGIEELRLIPARPENGCGQWMVLLGRNGLGKTT